MRTDAFFLHLLWNVASDINICVRYITSSNFSQDLSDDEYYILKICLMMNIIYHLANRVVHFFPFFITLCLKVRLKSDQFGQIVPESYTNNKWKHRVLSLPILQDRPGERSSYIFFCIKTICFYPIIEIYWLLPISLILMSLLMALS